MNSNATPFDAVLADEVKGFLEFMNIIANNLIRDNKSGIAFWVGVGAILSTVDALTYIYVIGTYYQSTDLFTQANAMLAMISANMICQIILVLAVYKKKGIAVKLKEVLICILFLRPMVDV